MDLEEKLAEEKEAAVQVHAAEIVQAAESAERLNSGYWQDYSPAKPGYESGGYQNKHELENFLAIMNFFPEHHPEGLYGTCNKESKAITIAEHTRRDIEQRELTKLHENIHAVTGLPDGYAVITLERAVAGLGWPRDKYSRGGANY